MEWRNAHTGNTVEEIVCAKSGLSVDELLSPASTSPKEIENLYEAARLIWNAVKAKEHITIFGDYDADGITSTTILVKLLKRLGATVSYRMPKRMSEGFGLCMNAVNELSPGGLLITVDNGVSAIDEIQAARDKGVKVIVLDHHLPEEGRLPNANIIVDPHIHPEKNGFEHYCGAGLSLKLAELFVKPGNFLDELTVYAAIGTIADVMPLVGDNRRIVKQGLSLLSSRNGVGLGLKVLMNEASLPHTLTENEIGFKIGPMLNAPGRMEDDGAQQVVELLLHDNPMFCKRRATYIININEARKSAVATAVDTAKRIIERDCLYDMVPLILCLPEVPEGIVGIVTGKLSEEYRRPCFVFTKSGADPDIYKGSGRTYGGVNLKTDLIDPVIGLLIRGGGHAGAAGITIHKDEFLDMVEMMCEQLQGYEIQEADTITYDMDCSENDVPAICTELEKFAPFGEGNPSPVFCIKNATLSPRAGAYYKLMGANSEHLKLLGKGFSAICFNMSEKYREIGCPICVDMVGTLSQNHFQFASENQMEAMDIKKSEMPTRSSALLSALQANGTI